MDSSVRIPQAEPFLPIELYRPIIDNLPRSKQDLSVYSLVCQSWLPLCRSHLFAEVTLQLPFCQFISSSDHAGSTISPHIRRVIVKDYGSEEIVKFVIEFVLCLPNLTSLHMEKLGREIENLPELISRDSPSPSHTLFASNVSSATLSKNVSYANFLVCSAAKRRAEQGITVKEVRIEYCCNKVILGLLQHANFINGRDEYHCCRLFPCLESIFLTDILPDEGKSFGEFFDSIGEPLKHLDILFSHPYADNKDPFRGLRLSKNTRLETLSIRGLTLYCFPPTTTTYEWLLTFLNTVKSPNVKIIAFHIWFGNEDHLKALPWSKLCAALVDIGMRELEFHITGGSIDTEVEQWLHCCLTGIDQALTVINIIHCRGTDFTRTKLAQI